MMVYRMRATFNPYLRAASLLRDRVLWDIRFQSWISRARLKGIKGSYRGKKAVILCNGPSLLNANFGMLADSGVYTFGLNKINLLFGKQDFRPSSIVAVNPFVIEQNAEFYNSTDILLFLDSCALKKGVSARKNLTFLHSANFTGEFARDCSVSINQGYSVTFVAMQLAYHLGFAQVALVGCDHNFATQGPANKTVRAEGRDLNHFDPNYFAHGAEWQLPDLFESEVAYQHAKQAFEEDGRYILNATDGGLLKVFPRVSLAEFLNANT